MINRLRIVLSMVLMWFMPAAAIWAADEAPLTVADPFIELRTGPGAGYPVFHVIDRGQQIVIVKRKTGWFRVRAANGLQGWVDKEQMQRTLLPDGSELSFAEDDQQAFIERQWELGATAGELKNAPIVSVYGGYAMTRNLSAELTLGHSVGNVSSSTLYKLNLLMQPYPDWRYSPFFTLGAGGIEVKPNATLIEPANRQNAMSQVGLGVKSYWTRQFVWRFEVNEYVIFSASNEEDKNEDIIEWKLGFAVFF